MSAEGTALKGLEKALDLIKAGGWQTAAAATALGILWWLVAAGVLPPFDPPWITHVVALAFLLCVALTIAAIASASVQPIANWIALHRAKRALASRAREAIPFMTEQERAIIGYLLHHKRKVFDADDDGGYAASLLGRGFVVILARRGQMLDLTRVPMTVPEPVWEVWEQHKEAFPYEPVMNRGHELHPWRIPWMVR